MFILIQQTENFITYFIEQRPIKSIFGEISFQKCIKIICIL